jgi:ribonuclease PH
MDELEGYRYPTREEIAADVRTESTAIAVAISAMSDALENCPLKDHLKVYAAIELAFKYGDKAYVEEVFSEVSLFIKESK